MNHILEEVIENVSKVSAPITTFKSTVAELQPLPNKHTNSHYILSREPTLLLNQELSVKEKKLPVSSDKVYSISLEAGKCLQYKPDQNLSLKSYLEA